MRGYTLLELLIVILLLGLLTGLALPSLYRLYESGRVAFEKDEVIRQIASLGYVAYSHGTYYQLARLPNEEQNPPLFELPDGWALTAEPPIQYHPNGVCLGGTVKITFGHSEIVLKLDPPLCKPEML